MNQSKVVFLYILGKKARFKSNDVNLLYFGSWSGYISKYISKIDSNISWYNLRQDYSVVNLINETVDGVKVEIFPYEREMLFGLVSFKLLRRLRALTSDRSAIIHCFNAHSLTSYLLVWLLRKNPVILTNYGHTPPRFLIKNTKSLFRKIKLLTLFFLEKIVYRYVDGFTPSGVVERAYLKTHFPNLLVAEFDHLGIDFNLFTPLEKKSARNRLGLPVEAKILLYVGHLYELKGVDAILESYKDLQNSYDNLQLILIGANEQDQLYEEAVLSGAIVTGHIEQDLLRVYYCASDVYLLPNFDTKDFINFGGIGTAPLEAMACNTPVISTHLIHFPKDHVDNVGINPNSRSALTSCIKKVIDNPGQFSNCRDIAKTFYDRNLIAVKLIELYFKLKSGV